MDSAAGLDEYEVDVRSSTLTSRDFDSLRASTRADAAAETISNASDEEPIPVDDEAVGDGDVDLDPAAQGLGHSRHTISRQPGYGRTAVTQDPLDALEGEGPLQKMKMKSAQAQMARKRQDRQAVLSLRQEILALARMVQTVYRDLGASPLLLSEAHFQLAKAYQDVGYQAQADDHCKRALEWLPRAPPGDRELLQQSQALMRDIHILTAEALMSAVQPKPQVAATQLLLAADNGSGPPPDPRHVDDPGIRALLAQCYASMGESKLRQAQLMPEVREQIEKRAELYRQRLGQAKGRAVAGSGARGAEVERLHKALDGASMDLADHDRTFQDLIGEALQQLDLALEMMSDTWIEADRKLRAQLGAEEAKRHPLYITLLRRACELSMLCGEALSVAGDQNKASITFGEVISHYQANPDSVPQALVAKAYKEQGAVRVKAKKYTGESGALSSYQHLLALQEERFQGDPDRLALHRGEALKLMGNVHVALKDFKQAADHYNQALGLFSTVLGPESGLVVDLKHRLYELRGYQQQAGEE